MAAAKRTPEQIRADIEKNRVELGKAVETLKSEFAKATDWRQRIRDNQETLMIGAAGAGFVLGGGIGGFFGLFRRKKKLRLKVE